MTDHYLRNITADYITGVVSACEGIHNSLILLNGPLGCKFYHGYSAGQSAINSIDLGHLRGNLKLCNAMEDKLLRSQYFAGSPQNPGTNLRYEDYIFGTRDQLHRALNDIFTQKKYDFFTVIQSPGTSLLGEALERELQEISVEFGLPYLFVEIPELSSDFCKGYDETTVKLFEKLLPPERKLQERESGNPSVNLFGFHTYEKFLEGGINEIRRLLALCGVDICCVAGADCPIDQIKRIPEADANIIFSPERCEKTAAWLNKRYQMPLIETNGMPIGFELTEKLIRQVGDVLKVDISSALEDIERGKARAFYFIARHLGPSGFPKELRYAVEGEYSLLNSYVSFLSGYFGVMPICTHVLFEKNEQAKYLLLDTLTKYHAQKAINQDLMQCQNMILLGSSTTIMEVTAYGHNIFGIEIANPTSGYVHVTPKTYLGVNGALYLLEQFINGNRLITANQEISGHWFPTSWK